MPADKRRYHANLTFIEQGFRACWQNAKDLVVSAKVLLDREMHAPALSLSVLALEETGKLMALDGLLFARHDDSKAGYFKDATRSHQTKLDGITLLPVFLANLSPADPRHGQDRMYAQAMAINIHNLQGDGNAILAELGDEGFRVLDKHKQQGFYASTTNKGFQPPRDNVEPELARRVYTLAWRATSSIDFALKGGNLERYLQNARSIRGQLTEAGHRALEYLCEQEAKSLFGDADENDLLRIN